MIYRNNRDIRLANWFEENGFTAFKVGNFMNTKNELMASARFAGYYIIAIAWRCGGNCETMNKLPIASPVDHLNGDEEMIYIGLSLILKIFVI